MRFHQCTMQKKELNKTHVLTSWLPSKFANKGGIVKLKDRNNGEWSDGWVIKQVSSFSRSQHNVIARSQDYKNTRKTSDI
jgi:hypothetical protein